MGEKQEFKEGDVVECISRDNHIVPYKTKGVVLNLVGSNICSVNFLGQIGTCFIWKCDIRKIQSFSQQPQQQENIESYGFRYTNSIKDISHNFNTETFDLDLPDIIANFRLFLLSIGYSSEHIGEFINEDML